ncbi:MAG: LPS export ABC transporter permease LptG [Gammaproteobacteria bacterium]|nr:LPS export ABC transporter permease LptG [Gammaproteobacteria bacterium]
MKVLDQYIGRTVIGGTLMALLVLGALLAFVDFVSEMGDVGKGQYGIVEVIAYVVLSLPKRIYELFPTAVLLGSLLSLGALAGNSELIVMRASGISIARIVRSVMQAGVVLVILVLLVGELLVPPSERKAQTVRAAALKQSISLGGQHGFWVKDGLRVMRVGRVYPDMQLGNLEIYQLNEQKKVEQIYHVKSARYRADKWQLKNIDYSEIGDTGVSSSYIAALEWTELFNPDLFNVVSVKPDNMSAVDLYKYSNYLADNQLDDSSYRLAFWIKVITPLSTLVMLIIALPFVFSSQRSGAAGGRVLVGLLLGIGFFLLNRTVNHMGQVYGLHPLMSAAFPVVMVAVLGLYSLKRIH